MFVKELFALKDRQILIVHIESLDCEWSKYSGRVCLRYGSTSIYCLKLGQGHTQMKPDNQGHIHCISALLLKLDDSLFKKVEEVEQLNKEYKGVVTIEKEK